jgi:hypothetical protein
LLWEYHVRAAVHCPPPRIHLMSAGEAFHCAIVGAARTGHLDVKMLPGGRWYLYRPSGLTTPQWYARTRRRHVLGKHTVVDGTNLANYIEASIEETAALRGIPAAEGRLECPSTVDLSGGHHGLCHMYYRGFKLRYVAWLDNADGFLGYPLDRVIDGSRLQRQLAADTNERLLADGYKPHARFICQPGIRVVPAHGAVFCDASAGNLQRRMRIEIEEDGTLRSAVADSVLRSSTMPSPNR